MKILCTSTQCTTWSNSSHLLSSEVPGKFSPLFVLAPKLSLKVLSVSYPSSAAIKQWPRVSYATLFSTMTKFVPWTTIHRCSESRTTFFRMTLPSTFWLWWKWIGYMISAVLIWRWRGRMMESQKSVGTINILSPWRRIHIFKYSHSALKFRSAQMLSLPPPPAIEPHGVYDI